MVSQMLLSAVNYNISMDEICTTDTTINWQKKHNITFNIAWIKHLSWTVLKKEIRDTARTRTVPEKQFSSLQSALQKE